MNALSTLLRGVVDVISREDLERKLSLGRPLRVKFGVDPTAPDIHLGHTVSLQKLRQFQQLGHTVQLVIGDYTAKIGDPSGRSETRPMLTDEEIAANMSMYSEQAFKILDPTRTELHYNSSWLSKLSTADIIALGSKYTVQQMLQRRDFGKRMDENKPLSITELLYPLFVGYDSVVLESDVELGGTDQLFNFVASRSVQTAYEQPGEVIMTLPLLEGVDGVRKMSKSYGNTIALSDAPNDMYGKIMSISDDLMVRYHELLSNVSDEGLEHIKEVVAHKTENPMRYKQSLAREITARFHGEQAATHAEAYFARIHQRHGKPEKIEALSVTSGSSILDVLVSSGKASSRSEARRLIEQGGVQINGEKITDHKYSVSENGVLQVGKRFFRELYTTAGVSQ